MRSFAIVLALVAMVSAQQRQDIRFERQNFELAKNVRAGDNFVVPDQQERRLTESTESTKSSKTGSTGSSKSTKSSSGTKSSKSGSSGKGKGESSSRRRE